MGWPALVWAGFVATTLATAVCGLFHSFSLTLFSPARQVGGLFLRDPKNPRTESLGLLLLFIVGSTLLPALYAALLGGWGVPSWRSGALLGMLHGLMTTAILPVYGMISACTQAGLMQAPRRFGLGWGRATPVAVVIGHLIYGSVLGAVVGSV